MKHQLFWNHILFIFLLQITLVAMQRNFINKSISRNFSMSSRTPKWSKGSRNICSRGWIVHLFLQTIFEGSCSSNFKLCWIFGTAFCIRLVLRQWKAQVSHFKSAVANDLSSYQVTTQQIFQYVFVALY